MRISYGISDVCSSDLRRLLPVSDGGPGDIGQFAAIGQMVDPPHPLEAESYLAAPLPAADEPPRQSRLGAILKLGLLLLVVAGCVLAWRYTSLADALSLQQLTDLFTRLGASGWARPRSDERRVGKEWVSTCRSRW